MEFDTRFWQGMEQLIVTNKAIIDRPKGTPHPRYPQLIYPLDYGYLENTTASDGDGIDIWMGSLQTKTLTGILCTFDKMKRDAEIKLLIGCTNEDVQVIRNFNNEMLTLFIPNIMEPR
ncbi:MAG: inorganic pyrophosphatase [Anaerolineales bacterium]|nr:inorganic pyrophosphatase [Anaerolineales bacterium]